MANKVFITYNPEIEIERLTALRMDAMASAFGVRIEFPLRYEVRTVAVSDQTVLRIKRAEIVIALCLGNMSKQLEKELLEAMKQKKTIVVLHEKKRGKTIDFGTYQYARAFYIDFDNSEQTHSEIAQFLKNIVSLPVKRKEPEPDYALPIAVVGIGLGLLTLWALGKGK